MQITQEQYEKIAKYFPRQRGNVSMSNLQLINAILYVTENGCKWRALPKTYGNWHTIYVRMNRWSKNGVLSRVFAALQTEGIIQINVEVVCLDRTNHQLFIPDAEFLGKAVNVRSAQNLAKIFGALAQLVARYIRIVEVRSSNLLCSTTVRPKTQFSDGYFIPSTQKSPVQSPKSRKKRGFPLRFPRFF